MDRRKKRTSTNQYMLYIEMMENDSIFASGRVPRDGDVNYLLKKWKELSDKLNTCSSGPTLTAEEWRKRLNDWKNTTRCKYRRSLSGEKDIAMTSLEHKALELFGKAPNNLTVKPELSIHLKSEKEDGDDGEMEHQRTSESFQKELQAAVEEAIGGDDEGDDEDLTDEHDEVAHEDSLNPDQIAGGTVVATSATTADVGSVGPPRLRGGGGAGNNASSVGGGGGGTTTTTYRTIVVENAASYDDDDEDDQVEYITQRQVDIGQRRHTLGPASSSTGVQTVVTAANVAAAAPTTTTVTKLINGDIPMKRLRTQAPDQIIYEVKKVPVLSQPRTITMHNSAAPPTYHPQHHQETTSHHHQQQHQQQHQQTEAHPTSISTSLVGGSNSGSTFLNGVGAGGISAQDGREIARQLKRVADIKSEELRFKIARFRFNNPGFNFNYHPL